MCQHVTFAETLFRNAAEREYFRPEAFYKGADVWFPVIWGCRSRVVARHLGERCAELGQERSGAVKIISVNVGFAFSDSQAMCTERVLHRDIAFAERVPQFGHG